MFPNSIDKLQIPHRPGVYTFKDNQGEVLYVGKAIDLYHRVASYFSASPASGRGNVKLTTMIEQINSVDTVIVESELEALILEANLIKKYLPPFNVRLTDDKDYLYIGISKEDFPKVVILRKHDLKKVKKFFGPFPSSRTVRDTLKRLRRVFPWCSSPQTRFVGMISNRVWKPKACFYYHIGLCPGACVGLISKEDYKKIIGRFSKFLDGKKQELMKELTHEMGNAADDQRFEEAGKVKKMIDGINYLTQINRTKSYLENPNFLQEETRLALEQLQKDLNLPKLPERIEGYDISNIQGKDATGSMVVLTHGEIDKSQYRRFKIHPLAGGQGRPNDVGMHKEVMRRRLKHAEWPFPDLILVDGGRGQVRAVNSILHSTNYILPIYGLAKRAEWLYPPEGDVIKLPRKSLSLKLLQKLRDESHRFAITYHRKLRDRIVRVTSENLQ